MTRKSTATNKESVKEASATPKKKRAADDAHISVDIENRTIRIDMDAKCSRCGQKGVSTRGLCLECITKQRLGQFIDLEGAVIASAKHDIVTHGVQMVVAADWQQFPEHVRTRLAEIVENEHMVAITFKLNEAADTITFDNCQLATIKHDVVAHVVKVSISLSFKQVVAEFRNQIAMWAAAEAPLRVTIEPKQPLLIQTSLLQSSAGRLD